MTAPLLQTKLYTPPVRPEVVSRPRLIDRLNAGLPRQSGAVEDPGFARKLTLISAPAGFGKTTLLSEWVQALDEAGPSRAVAWLSLDESDNDPTRFLAYLIAALQTVRADVGIAAMAMLQSRQPLTAEAILSTLINEIATITQGEHDGHPWVLVLDDYHRITAHPVHEALTFLLDHLPPRVHLAIAGRADPPLPLARLRARGQLTELRAADLRFASDEVVAFLNDVMALGLSPEDIATLDARTEGWIAGLQMAALSMRGRGDVTRFIKAFSGSHRFVLDYLVEEVLDQQPPLIQDFLLKTSILERMTAPLCDAVTEGSESQTILIQLDRTNLFLIPLDDERGWYRYHHLFVDLLRSRMEQTHPDQVPTLHRRASEWYAQNGLIAEAVRHMLLAGDVERVADLVEGNALAMMDRGELHTLAESLDVLPDEVMRSRPWLSVAHAWVLAYVGQFDAIEPRLQDAESALGNREGPAEIHHVAGHIATIRGYITALKGDMSRAAELARRALEHLPEEDLKARAVAAAVLGGALKESGDLLAAAQALSRAIAIARAAGDSHVAVTNLCDLTRLQILQGRLHEAAATCRRALQLTDEYARQSGWRLPVTGHVYTHLSRVLREWNDLETATRLAREGVALCRQWGWSELLVYGGVYLAETRQAIGDTEGALDAMRTAKEAGSSLSTRFVDLVEAHETLLWLAQGNMAAASRWAERSGLSINDEFIFQDLLRYVTLARVLIGRSRLDEASRLLARLLNMAEAAGAMGEAIEILILQALTQEGLGKRDQALTPLERALSLAEPEGYVRTFIDEGAPMGELLRRAAAQGIRLNYVSALLAALESDAKTEGAQGALIEPLSARELEVLRVLATGLSNKEIAETLFIAVGTVKQHLKSIYGKLQVHSRTEAAHRARDLGLL
jgi:LuxR family maltose regulon positive regulatory protein